MPNGLSILAGLLTGLSSTLPQELERKKKERQQQALLQLKILGRKAYEVPEVTTELAKLVGLKEWPQVSETRYEPGVVGVPGQVPSVPTGRRITTTKPYAPPETMEEMQTRILSELPEEERKAIAIRKLSGVRREGAMPTYKDQLALLVIGQLPPEQQQKALERYTRIREEGEEKVWGVPQSLAEEAFGGRRGIAEQLRRERELPFFREERLEKGLAQSAAEHRERMSYYAQRLSQMKDTLKTTRMDKDTADRLRFNMKIFDMNIKRYDREYKQYERDVPFKKELQPPVPPEPPELIERVPSLAGPARTGTRTIPTKERGMAIRTIPELSEEEKREMTPEEMEDLEIINREFGR